jgi:hypothetical protein
VTEQPAGGHQAVGGERALTAARVQARADGLQVDGRAMAADLGELVVGELGGFVPAARPVQRVGGDAHEMGPIPAAQPDPACELATGQRLLDRLLAAISEQQVEREVVVGHHDDIDGRAGFRELPRQAELLQPLLHPAERHEARSEHASRPTFLDGGSHGARHPHRLLARAPGLGMVTRDHQGATQRSEHVGAFERGRLSRHQVCREAVLRERLVALIGDPAEEAEALVEHARDHRVGCGIDERQRIDDQPFGGRAVARQVERIGGAQQQVDLLGRRRGGDRRAARLGQRRDGRLPRRGHGRRTPPRPPRAPPRRRVPRRRPPASGALGPPRRQPRRVTRGPRPRRSPRPARPSRAAAA